MALQAAEPSYPNRPVLAMAEIIGGKVHRMFVDVAAGQSHGEAGRLRAIGVMSDKRSSALSVKAVNKPAVNQRLVEMGLELAPGGPDELTRFVARQLNSWGVRIKAAGIRPE